MPRYVVNESEDESEPRTGRRTRAALAASTTDSPIRRSTRIRHGSVNPDGSSPESVVGATAPAAQVTRVTRRRATAATTNTLTVPEPTRNLRSRKNSASSNVSESLDIESVPGTPKTRSLRRLSIVDPSPSTPKVGTQTRRSTRASSETKSPQPVVRTTRRTRATSIDPEPTIERTATPTKKRRQQVSALPSEPVLTEEANEDKVHSKIDKVIEIPEVEAEDETSPEKTPSESSRKSSPASAKKLSKNDLAREETDEEVKLDESLAEKLSEKSFDAGKISSVIEKSGNDTDEELELLKTPDVEEVSAADIKAQETPKPKRNSLDKSKELGMKIEDLLNKSTEEHETSPGNKENQKLNVVSPDKVKKNIEFTVSNVNIVRGKSIGSSKFVNKSSERKMNTSLDERVLSKSRYDIVAPKSTGFEANKLISDAEKSKDSNQEKKSQAELPSVFISKKNEKGEVPAVENGSKTAGYTRIEETIVENEIIEEFTLYDSENDSKSEFSLAMEDDDDEIAEKTGPITETNKNQSQEDLDEESESDSDIFDKPNPSRIKSRKNSSEIILRDKEVDTQVKRFSLNSEEAEANKKDKKKKSADNKEADNLLQENSKSSNLENKTNSEKNIEPMDTTELEETEANEKEKSSELEKPKIKSKDQVSDSDSSMAIDNLFKNISAEEWSKKQKNQSPKESQTKRKSSLKSQNEADDTEEDLIVFEEKSWKAKSGKETSDSDDTLILKNTDSAKKSAKNKKNSPSKMIVEEPESENSRKKSKKLNTSMENNAKDKIEEETSSKNPEEENISEAETIPTNTEDTSELQRDDSESEDTEKEEEEEKDRESSKKLKKNGKNKSPGKSLKSKESGDVYEFKDSSAGEEEDKKESEESTDEENEKTRVSINRKAKSVLDKLKTPLGKNYSIVAVADSDSGPDMPSSDNSEHSMPGYLFNVAFSSDEEAEENSHNTIDSDIAREMNLAGDTSVKYSDDDVPGDDCRASESEHSEDEDEGSDLEDFVIADDEVESSVYSDDEFETKTKFKRILDKSSSEDETEAEKTGENGEEKETEKSNEKRKRKSLRKTPDQKSESEGKEIDEGSSDLLAKTLNFSLDSDKALSSKKTKRGEVAPDSGELYIEPSHKKLKKFSKPLRSLLNSTIDLCTPVQDATDKDGDKSPGLNTSEKNKSLKKLKKCLVEDLGTSTPEGDDLTREDEEEEPVFTPKQKTPGSKDKKTPKSGRKSQRDSIQGMEETQSVKENEGGEEEKPMFTTKEKTPGKEKKTTPKSGRRNQKDSIELMEEIAPAGIDSIQADEKEERISTPKEKTPGKEKRKTPKSGRKNQKDLIQLMEEIAPEGIDLIQADEEEERISTPKEKTPGKEKRKTPKSGRKNVRDSLQLIDEAALVSSNVSNLNKTMSTPNSESPTTKFLKKERLNESLPLLELKKRASRSFDKKALSAMNEDEQEAEKVEEEDENEGKEKIAEESEDDESDEDDNDNGEENSEEVNANGDQNSEEEDEDEEEEEDDDGEEEEKVENPVEENEQEEESEESTEEEIMVRKTKRNRQIKRKSLTETEEPVFSENMSKITPGKNKKLSKRQSVESVTIKSTELESDILTPKKKRCISTPGCDSTNRKKRARLETMETPQGLKVVKKLETAETVEAESSSDEAPESLGFSEARTDALQEMKEVAASVKALKETKKKKRRDQLDRIRNEKELKAAKKSSSEVKNNLKRLPEDLLENLSEVAERPKKKRKLLKKDEKLLPSRYMFSPGKTPKSSLKIEEYNSPVSTGGGTTQFSVVNLEKVKKQPKKAAAVASFRDRMLARNPRQPVSAFLMYQAKQKASGKQLASRKQA